MNAPINLTPAEPEPPTLLELLHRSVGVAELHGVIVNYRGTETPEEET